MMKWVLPAALVILLVAASPALAGFISMTTATDTLVMNESSATLNVTVSNSGDEAANDVRISLLLPAGFSAPAAFAGTLEPESSYTAAFDISATEVKDGDYTFAVLVEYRDANRYGFSAVSPSSIIFNAPSASGVTATLRSATVDTQGSMTMSLRNLEDVPRNVSIRLHLPKELSSLEAMKTVVLSAGETRQETFVIDNAGALEGSTYAVFAVISYEDDTHHSSVASSSIRIGTETTTVTQPGESRLFDTNLVIAIILILALLLIIYQLRGRFRGRKNEPQPGPPPGPGPEPEKGIAAE